MSCVCGGLAFEISTLSNFQIHNALFVVHNSHCAVHYSSGTYASRDWKFVTLTSFTYFPHPMATISLLRFYEFDFYRGCGIKETLVETVADCVFWGSKITTVVIAAMKLKDAYSLEGKL